MKNILLHILLVTLALCFALQSCGLEEMHDTQNGAESGVIEFVARQISYDNMNVGTKATSAEIAAWENNIYTAFFMVFDNSGNRIIYRDLSPSSGHLTSIPSQTLQADKRYTNAKVCYLVNVSSDFAEDLTTYALLTSTPISIEYAPISSTGCIGVPLLKKTSTDAGTPAIPMFGYAENCNLSAVTSGYQTNPISLNRLFAKVDVKLNVQNGITFNLTNYTVNNIPTNVMLLPPAQGDPTAYATSGVFLTSENTMTSYNLIDATTGDVTTGFFFYVPEHMQGGAIEKDNVNNTVESNKPLLVSGTNMKPTYVEINGALSTDTAEYTGKYSIYLGKNETNNFDLERNTYYKNTVTIKGLTAENRVELLGGDQYTNLVDGEAANCYIITAPGKYILPAYMGATKSLEGADMCYGKPSVVWTELDNDAIVFTYPDKNDSKIVFEVSSESGKFKAGNALIAIVDDKNTPSDTDDDEILWSWHLWFCPDGAPSTQDYGNMNYMMDRFLGAKTKASDGISLVSQYIDLYWKDGLYYQWGRKDPLNVSITTGDDAYEVAEGDDLNLTIQNPNTFYKNWASNNGWTVSKAKHDPCPAGYKVPQSSIWTKSEDDFNRFTNSNQYIFVYNLFQPTILYPYYGFLDSNGIRQSGQKEDAVLKEGTYNMLGLGNLKDYPLYPSTQTELESRPSSNPRRYDSASYQILNDKKVGEVWGVDKALEYGYEDRGIIITAHKYQEGTWVSYTSIKWEGWTPVTITKYRADYDDSGDWSTETSTSTNGVYDDKLPDNVREKFMRYIKADFTWNNLGSEIQSFFENLGNLGEWAQQGVVYNKTSIATSNGYNLRCVKE